MPNFRDLHRSEQADLDRFASRLGWDRGRFKSWRYRGFTISVGATGYPRRHWIAAKGDDVREFDDLDALAAWVRTRAPADS